MKVKIVKVLSALLVLAIILFLYPIGILAFTDAKIAKSLFTEEYYAKITSNEYDFNVFRDYMELRGWKENDSKRMGGLHIFEKNGQQKEILNTDVKTIFIDGKLNF